MASSSNAATAPQPLPAAYVVVVVVAVVVVVVCELKTRSFFNFLLIAYVCDKAILSTKSCGWINDIKQYF